MKNRYLLFIVLLIPLLNACGEDKNPKAKVYRYDDNYYVDKPKFAKGRPCVEVLFKCLPESQDKAWQQIDLNDKSLIENRQLSEEEYNVAKQRVIEADKNMKLTKGMMKSFEEMEHTADRAIRASGCTLEELFTNAARGMFSLMADLEELTPTVSRPINLEAFDLESLLVDWLNELLYLQESEGEIYTDFHIAAFSPTKLEATVSGAKAEPHKAKVKAATFHNLAIEKTPEGYIATIVFDV